MGGEGGAEKKEEDVTSGEGAKAEVFVAEAKEGDAVKEEGTEEKKKEDEPKVSTAAVSSNTGKRPFVKPLRAEWNRSVAKQTFFSKNLYVANLNVVRDTIKRPATPTLHCLRHHVGPLLC
jgi:hypothetical protein